MGKKLIILFHGFASSRVFDQVRELGAELFPEDEIYTPKLAYRNRFAPKRAITLIEEELEHISHLANQTQIDEVVLCGYSMGGLTLRRILAEAHHSRADGAPSLSNLPALALDWTHKISRFVAIAGMAQPWSMQDPKNPLVRALWHLGKFYCAITPLGQPIVMDFENIQPFVHHTQQAWNRLLKNQGVSFDIIRLHGARDNLVLPGSSEVFDDSATRGQFLDIKIPHTGHEGIINFKQTANVEKNALRTRRRELIGQALRGDLDILTTNQHL